MVHITRIEHFNAAHKLFNPNWSKAENEAVFGKCANENWHGHNFELHVTLCGNPSPDTGFVFDVKKLSNTTFLYWKAPKTGNAKGYYILMRETTSPVWQKKMYTEALEARLPYSKDNYFFAVQSVNEFGNESLPVIPAVGR